MTWSLLLSWEGCSASEEARSSSVGTGENNLGICVLFCFVFFLVFFFSFARLLWCGSLISCQVGTCGSNYREYLQLGLYELPWNHEDFIEDKDGGMGAFSVGAVELSCPIEWVEFEASSNKTRAGQLCMHSTEHCVRIWLVGSSVQLLGDNPSLLNLKQ